MGALIFQFLKKINFKARIYEYIDKLINPEIEKINSRLNLNSLVPSRKDSCSSTSSSGLLLPSRFKSGLEPIGPQRSQSENEPRHSYSSESTTNMNESEKAAARNDGSSTTKSNAYRHRFGPSDEEKKKPNQFLMDVGRGWFSRYLTRNKELISLRAKSKQENLVGATPATKAH